MVAAAPRDRRQPIACTCGAGQSRGCFLADLMAQSDAVSVHTIYASRYKGFINANVLSHCRPGQLWVSVSRSSLFDPQALGAALTDGRIEAMLMDGAETGFASRESPLHQLGNLHLTPRVGSFTREAQLRAEGLWVDDD